MFPSELVGDSVRISTRDHAGVAISDDRMRG